MKKFNRRIQFMKKFKILLTLVLSFALLIGLTGCGKKTAIGPEDFKKKMEDAGYNVTDVTSQYANSEYAMEKVYIAYDNDKTHQLEFYKVSSSEEADRIYESEKKKFEATASDNKTYSNVELGNYKKYVLKSNGTFKLISKIDDTFIYCNVDDKFGNKMAEFVKNFGY